MKNKEKVLIVGGGTAGLVAGRRLAAKFDVEILEKSKQKSLPLFNQIPLMIGLLFKSSNRFIKTIHFKGPRNRMIPYFLSQVLGGSSVMNGCVHVFGNRKRWNKLLDRFSINEEELNSSYRELYSTKSEKAGISISDAPASNLDRAFVDAFVKMNIPIGDTEYADKPTVGPIVNTVGRFFRSSVLSLKYRKDIKIRRNTGVDYLAVNDAGEIVGAFSKGKLYSSSIVVLCAGVIGTNELLMKKAINIASGAMIDMQLDAGTGIADHANLRVDVRCPIPIGSLNEVSSTLVKKSKLFLSHLVGKRSLMMGTGATSAVNLDLDGDGEVDTRINLLRFYESGRKGAGLFSSTHPGFSLSITMINPSSRGKITFEDGQYVIKPGYLDEKYDNEFIEKALIFTLELMNREQLSDYVESIYSHEEILNDTRSFIEKNVFSGYHLIGGCADLVKSDFSLKGLSGLYVCDASVLNEYPASNIHSTVVLLADLFAKKLLAK